jgi:hypothetical protein
MPNGKNFARTLAVGLVLISATLPITAQDIEKLKERATAGEGVAQYDLALMYDNGQGVAQDSMQAALWYRKAAENSVVQAEYRLGYDYFLGRGIPQNYAQSSKWWHKAAAQGYAPAEVGLGLSYYAGKGVSASNAKSYFWLDIAASGNLESGRMKNVIEMRDSVGSQLSTDVLAQTQELVEKWVESATPRLDPYQAQEDALREKQAQPSSTPYADQFLAQMQVRDAADPNSAYSQRLVQQRKMQETMNQVLPKLVQALLDDPRQTPAI